jgi:hypothetical protein
VDTTTTREEPEIKTDVDAPRQCEFLYTFSFIYQRAMGLPGYKALYISEHGGRENPTAWIVNFEGPHGQTFPLRLGDTVSFAPRDAPVHDYTVCSITGSYYRTSRETERWQIHINAEDRVPEPESKTDR